MGLIFRRLGSAPPPAAIRTRFGKPPSTSRDSPGRRAAGRWKPGLGGRRQGPSGRLGLRQVLAAQGLHAASFVTCGEVPPLSAQISLRALGSVQRASSAFPSLWRLPEDARLPTTDMGGWSGKNLDELARNGKGCTPPALQRECWDTNTQRGEY